MFRFQANSRYREQWQDEVGFNRFKQYGPHHFERYLMCNCGWEELIGAALAVAGAGTQMYANNQTQSAENQATQNEINLQNNYAKKGQQVFQQSLGQSTPQAAQQQIQQGQQLAANSIANAQATPLSLSTPSIGNVQTAQDSTRQGMSNKVASNYFGQSNYPLQQYLKDLKANSQLGVIGNQSQQAARNFPTYLGAAAQSQQGLSALGSLLGTGGSLLGAFGSATAPTTGSSAFGLSGYTAPQGFASSPFYNQWQQNLLNNPFSSTTTPMF